MYTITKMLIHVLHKIIHNITSKNFTLQRINSRKMYLVSAGGHLFPFFSRATSLVAVFSSSIYLLNEWKCKKFDERMGSLVI